MVKVDVVASLRHYRDHLLPIYECLPRPMQGTVHPEHLPFLRPHADRFAMVAGWQDVVPLQARCPIFYVEHGAGQSYAADPRSKAHPSYSASGGRHHRGVVGFISPSQHVADRWTTAPSIAVGCPKMDQYIGLAPMGPPSVCFAWHCDLLVCHETKSAFAHYQADLAVIVDEFRAQGFGVYGHAHPRWNGELDQRMIDAGLTVLHFDRDVFHTASLLFVDNSSLAYEFASLGRPVVSLNAPWFRRDVNHGLRFWDHIPGIAVDGPDELIKLDIADVLANDPGLAQREAAVAFAYAHCDGASAERAAAFIVQRIAEL